MILALTGSLTAAAIAQHQGHMQHHDHGGMAQSDSRELVQMPDAIVRPMLSNMRNHLAALQEIQSAMAQDKFDDAASIAESRLGMSSLGLHGAHDIAPLMPAGMQQAGTEMHRAASRFAIAVKDAGVSGDNKPALAALAAVTAQCVACHTGYRIR
ncbi:MULTISPECIES: hypothetical protein [Rhodopseudomonas]|nr:MULTISPECIES: hypothetical protein [Rhodopseudomonas]MDF3809417.1 hypothetical protein [Rhodopseudomonas sp. BAL398]WOK16353.1 hypothetical protein RBJ75_19620 [Rhodopseudomonas sp. BAL398]